MTHDERAVLCWLVNRSRRRLALALAWTTAHHKHREGCADDANRMPHGFSSRSTSERRSHVCESYPLSWFESDGWIRKFYRCAILFSREYTGRRDHEVSHRITAAYLRASVRGYAGRH